MQTIKQTILTIIICLAVVAGVSMVSAWTGPTQAPPSGNTSEPINVSATSQYKAGAFGVGGILHGYSTAIFDGNVGIGTTAPGYKLDVQGTIGAQNRFSLNYPTTGVYDDATSNSPYSRLNADSFHTSGLGVGQMFIEGSAIDANAVIRIGSGVAGGQTAQNAYFGGNVGIGTASPGAKLEVAGQVKITGGSPGANKVLTSDASGLATWQTPSAGIGGSGTTNYISKWNGATSLGNSVIYDNGTNVGIGTASPGYKLDVQGTIGAQNRFSLNYPTTGVYDDATSNSPYSRLNADSFHTSGLGVGQMFIEGSAIDANAVIRIGSGVAGGQTAQNAYFGGNVGIGTASPGAKLEVAGQVKITGGSPGANKVLTSDASGLATWQTPVAGAATETDPTVSAWAKAADDSKYLNTTATTQYKSGALGVGGVFTAGSNAYITGNVGIGIASPDPNYKLTTSGGGVKAGNSSATTPAGYFSNSGGGAAIMADTGGITLGGVNKTSWPSGQWSDGAGGVIYYNGGNVGIGTTAPGTNKLQVNGKIQAIGGDICTDQGGGKCLSAAGGGDIIWFGNAGALLKDGANITISCSAVGVMIDRWMALGFAKVEKGKLYTQAQGWDDYLFSNPTNLKCDSGWVEGTSASCSSFSGNFNVKADTTVIGLAVKNTNMYYPCSAQTHWK